MDSLSRHYKEIVNRIKSKTPDFDEYKFHILVVDENNFDGMPVQSCTISKDRKWICIPREYEDQLGVDENNFDGMPVQSCTISKR